MPLSETFRCSRTPSRHGGQRQAKWPAVLGSPFYFLQVLKPPAISPCAHHSPSFTFRLGLGSLALSRLFAPKLRPRPGRTNMERMNE